MAAQVLSSHQRFRGLNPDHHIAIVEPAYRLDAPDTRGLEQLLKPFKLTWARGDRLRNSDIKLEVPDAARAKALMEAIRAPETGAVLIGHGGYGCSRLLPHLDYDMIAKARKPIIGFSDATALFMACLPHATGTCIHGPTAKSLLSNGDNCSRDGLVALLGGNDNGYNNYLARQAKRTKQIRAGSASGPLVGGNLSLLTSLLGTPYFNLPAGALLFLEDWNEPQYRIDRMLTQLSLAGVFERVRGVIVGEMTRITREGLDIAETLVERIFDLVPAPAPIMWAFPAGHGQTNFPFLLGANYAMGYRDLRLLR